jgi:hypothetical protein
MPNPEDDWPAAFLRRGQAAQRAVDELGAGVATAHNVIPRCTGCGHVEALHDPQHGCGVFAGCEVACGCAGACPKCGCPSGFATHLPMPARVCVTCGNVWEPDVPLDVIDRIMDADVGDLSPLDLDVLESWATNSRTGLPAWQRRIYSRLIGMARAGEPYKGHYVVEDSSWHDADGWHEGKPPPTERQVAGKVVEVSERGVFVELGDRRKEVDASDRIAALLAQLPPARRLAVLRAVEVLLGLVDA